VLARSLDEEFEISPVKSVSSLEVVILRAFAFGDHVEDAVTSTAA